MLCGTANSGVDQTLTPREEIGDFGVLVHAGRDWVDPARSMELMATEAMPRVNK